MGYKPKKIWNDILALSFLETMSHGLPLTWKNPKCLNSLGTYHYFSLDDTQQTDSLKLTNKVHMDLWNNKTFQ